MDPSFDGLVLDPSKCSKLSMEEKRELVYQLSKRTQGAPEMLQSWSRKDLLEILCAEMGKERKYTGLTKCKLIEHLLRIVSEKKSGKQVEDIDSSSPPLPNAPSSKRQRKNANPSRLPVGTSHIVEANDSKVVSKARYCQNAACRATMSLQDVFCKRCSCCICHKYDDNKDPSLWLVCSSEPPSQGESCGMSCHLECALQHERAGIAKDGHSPRLDGSFYCISCRKVNDLLGCWRKQLVIAKDARRVDILCYRVSLSHKLLDGTEKFRNLHEIVDTAVKKLEAEVGTLDGLPTKMARGIVNRLSSGAEVQKLCAFAIASLDSLLSSIRQLPPDPKIQESGLGSSSIISFKDVSTTSLTVVVGSEEDVPLSEDVVSYTLWHRKVLEDYPTEPTCKLVRADRKISVPGLMPATEYMFKVVAFRHTRELGNWEIGVTTDILKDVPMSMAVDEGSMKPNDESPKTHSSGLSNPSEGDESNNTAAYADLNKLPETHLSYHENPEVPDLEKSPDSACKEKDHFQETLTATMTGRTQAMGQEEMPKHSDSALDEEPDSTIQTDSQKDSTNSTDLNQTSDVPKSENESNAPVGNEMIPYDRSESVPLVAPSKLETSKEGMGRSGRMKLGSSGLEKWFPKPEKEPQVGSSSKRGIGRCEEICNKDGSLEGDYEYCVKVIRWLECRGHIGTDFRVKFLTWFSLQATPQERRVVSVFVDTLIDDPGSLAGQLVDTFTDGINSKRPTTAPSGFCMKLWH